jgi:MarR family transcriptional regulator, organic hydroperoxide resistance regulator
MIKTHGGFLVSQIKHLSGRVFEKMLKNEGIDIFNGPQSRILYILWEHGNLTISEIGRLTSLAKTTLTGMLDRMEESDLVQRIPDKNNRRQIIISFTEKAKTYKEKYDRVSNKMSELFYQDFSDKEIMQFENDLRRILSNLETEGDNHNE